MTRDSGSRAAAARPVGARSEGRQSGHEVASPNIQSQDTPMSTDDVVQRLTRPIIGIQNRTPLEVFDMMCDRIRGAALSPHRDQVLEEALERKWTQIRQSLNREHRAGIISYRELKFGLNYAAALRETVREALKSPPSGVLDDQQ